MREPRLFSTANVNELLLEQHAIHGIGSPKYDRHFVITTRWILRIVTCSLSIHIPTKKNANCLDYTICWSQSVRSRSISINDHRFIPPWLGILQLFSVHIPGSGWQLSLLGMKFNISILQYAYYLVCLIGTSIDPSLHVLCHYALVTQSTLEINSKWKTCL